jgi:hypothetical protein
MTTEQKMLAEFEAIFQEEKKAAQVKVANALNLNAVQALKEATAKVKQYTIEDVTPIGYGN